jgi:hypothetical protein
MIVTQREQSFFYDFKATAIMTDKTENGYHAGWSKLLSEGADILLNR